MQSWDVRSSCINSNTNMSKYSAQQLGYEWMYLGMKQRWIDRIHVYYKLVINYVGIIYQYCTTSINTILYEYVINEMNVVKL